MHNKIYRNQKLKRIVMGVTIVLLIIPMSACLSAKQTPITTGLIPKYTATTWPAVSSATLIHTPTEQQTPIVTKTASPHPPTLTFTISPSPTPIPRSLEAYGLSYRENALPNLPPSNSISQRIWPNGLPSKPIENAPKFVLYSQPEPPQDDQAFLEQAGCEASNSYIDCVQDSPLTRFSCDSMFAPQGVSFGLQPNLPLLAICLYEAPFYEEPKDEYLYREGCSHIVDVGYIFIVNEEYVLVKTEKEMRDLFAPIESSNEALSYSQMVTGLSAQYKFSFDETKLYLQETIEGTRIIEANNGFEVNLYHYSVCGCEPSITSQVDITINRNGFITWNGAKPISLTTGEVCTE